MLTMAGTPPSRGAPAKSCRGIPVRCTSRSSSVASSLATGSASFHSGITDATFVVQSRFKDAFEMRRPVDKARKSLLFEAMANSVSGVTGTGDGWEVRA